ncbi:MAG: polyprenyl synthetase family protein [Nannocystaceae bacterium]
MNESELMAYFDDRRSQVDQALDTLLAAKGDDPYRLREAMRYAVLGGGKRMRPLLTIAACEAAGGQASDAMPAACAVELVHAYSLVHDDLPAMDDDDERRGKPTVHVAFGQAAAVLAGDALLTLAFGAFAGARGGSGRSRPFEAMLELATRSGIDGMVGGQAIDLQAGQDIRDLQQLERLHALKTGGLYQAGGAMGALMAGADDAQVDRLRRYGLAFGIAFQHADDVLDDDQPALRQAALVRVEELVRECEAMVDGLGTAAEPLRGIARWVSDRTARAMAGEIAD